MNAHVIALATVFVWGVTFVSTKVLLVSFSPVEILLMRFLLAFVALWVLRPRVLHAKRRAHELLFAGAGLTGIALYYLLENIALVYTSASNVGVIVAVSPLFTALIAMALRAEGGLGARFFVGFALSMAGIALVSFQSSDGSFAMPQGGAGDVLALLAALVWAAYSTIVKRLSDLGYETIASTKRTFAWGLVFMVPAVLISGVSFDGATLLEPTNAANLLFLGFVASAACFVTWGVAVARLGAARTSAYIYLVPVITVVASVVILGEPFTLQTAVGVALTVGGLILSEGRCGLKRS